MADQRIEGKYGTTVISESFAPHGTITVPSGPAEDPTRWHSEKVDEKWLTKRYDERPFDLRRYGFPDSCTQTPIAGTIFRMGYTRHEWKLDAVLEWEDRIHALAAKLPKR